MRDDTRAPANSEQRAARERVVEGHRHRQFVRQAVQPAELRNL